MTPRAPRLVAVWVPDWPVVALALEARGRRRAPADRAREAAPDPALAPVAVVGGRGVVAASAPARAAGVATGMRLRVARALCPGLVAVPSRPGHEARGFEAVMEALGSLLADPLVARPGLALSGARGPASWAGGEEALAAALVEAVAEAPGAECQVGIADSLLGAVLAAHEGIIVPAGRAPAFLSPWPLEAVLAALPTHRLRHEARGLLEILARLGLRSLGDLAALPARDVAARFGAAGERLHGLASGASWRVPETRRPEAELTVEAPLDPPVSRADAAAFAARAAAEDLAARLAAHGLAPGRLLVEARCEDGTGLARSWMLRAVPTPAELTDRVRWQLEGWLSGRAGRPPAAPLEHLRLSALEPAPEGAGRAGLWTAPGEQGERRAHRAAERVESLLGAGALQVPGLAAGRDPRSRSRPALWGERAPSAAGATGTGAPWAGSLPAPSPSVVPERPAPAVLVDAEGRDVLVDRQGQLEGVPARLEVDRPQDGGWGGGRWEGHRRVVSWAGPWPVDEGWWRPEGASRRAYLQVVADPGPPLLLVRAGRWWLDAVYD
ncbi:DNA polymerase Y family protein [Actinomyces israelii]|uniref:DNA polymerase Y family protein n=1 Tax=Actinomyces israelii TaxID=1659 RepID=A0ABT4I489_9ACTO|nr:DNA polymerase Y family protein [Actinomyces israelii]MCZ0856547.1 DNA polymerase Y family protein [Actinomyces israelii]WKR21905.1 DNA polymerase IV [Actinomyces israelii]